MPRSLFDLLATEKDRRALRKIHADRDSTIARMAKIIAGLPKSQRAEPEPCRGNRWWGPNNSQCEDCGKGWTEHACTRCQSEPRMRGWSYGERCHAETNGVSDTNVSDAPPLTGNNFAL